MQPREPLLSSATPFNEQLLLLEHVNDAAVFYSGKQHGKHLDLLLHLSRYSNLLLTVTGQQGSGKTHLKNRMLQQLDSGVVVSLLDAKQTASAAQVLPKLSQNLNLEIPARADFNFYLEEIRHFSNQLNVEGGSCLIVIDNAENLEQDALDLILELATTISDSQRPHIALFGRQELFNKLHHKDNLARFESVGHHLPLEAFSESEAKSYLEHRCASVGIENLPLNAQAFANVYKASKGLPGLLNKALVEQLRRSANSPEMPSPEAAAKQLSSPAKPAAAKAKKGKAAKPSQARRLPLWLILTVAGLLAALLVGFFYKDQLLPSATPETSLTSNPPTFRQGMVLDPPPRTPIKTEPTVATQPAPLPVPEETPVAEVLLDLPDDTPSSVQPTQAQKPLAAVPVPPKPVAATPPPAKVLAPTNPWVDKGARRETLLMAKPADHYTLQMMGSLDETAVKNYIEAQGAEAANFSYFEGRYQNKPWYVVVYGDYTNRDEALAAVQKLPEALQKQRPWAKNFLSVQNDIRSR
ncbi:MAG: AAA family ATPase [Pseudomonadaceae bacterium]|nr:AAA family ATPase [Pseudomonadaceae bacterium]